VSRGGGQRSGGLGQRRTEERQAGTGEGADGGGNDGESAGTEKILQRGATAEARAPPPRRRSTLDVCK
jgi:hypothetical protein